MRHFAIIVLAMLSHEAVSQHYEARVATGGRIGITIHAAGVLPANVPIAAGQEAGPLEVHISQARGAAPAFDVRANGQTQPVAAGTPLATFTPAQFGFADFVGRDFDILESGVLVGQFRTVVAGGGAPAVPAGQGTSGSGTATTPPKPVEPVAKYMERIASTARATPYGLQLSSSEFTSYPGRKYVHLFFDQNGSPLLSTVPQGISNYQYVAHVVYLTKRSDPVAITYSVLQTKGEFSDALVFRNMEAERAEKSGGTDFTSDAWAWTQSEVLLRTSTNEIEFEINRNITTVKDALPSIATERVATHTIPMSKVYHGSFDVGLVNSTLENPTFSLVADPNNPDGTVLKREGGGNRGIVTLMMTFYSSPFMWFKPKGSIPDYKRYGRNFLDDVKWYERVYPCVGVGISDKAFENLFFGFNWELVRGGGIWFGYHYGRVRTFDAPDGFEYGVTPISQAEFELRSDNAWRLSEINEHTDFTPSIGANIDLRLITRLFSGGGSGAPDTSTP